MGSEICRILQVVRTVVLLHRRYLCLVVPAQGLRNVGLAAEDADTGIVIDEGVHSIFSVVGSGRELVVKRMVSRCASHGTVSKHQGKLKLTGVWGT